MFKKKKGYYEINWINILLDVSLFNKESPKKFVYDHQQILIIQ